MYASPPYRRGFQASSTRGGSSEANPSCNPSLLKTAERTACSKRVPRQSAESYRVPVDSRPANPTGRLFVCVPEQRRVRDGRSRSLQLKR
jgi:hypothetical protein